MNKTLIQGVESCTDVIIPEYRTYIENDTSLDTMTKRIRVQTADKLNSLIEISKGDD